MMFQMDRIKRLKLGSQLTAKMQFAHFRSGALVHGNLLALPQINR